MRMRQGLKVAIYDTPKAVSKSLAAALRVSGHQVIFDGPLNADNAKSEADIWITKWSFGLNRDLLANSSPRIGLVTLSVGTEHIDKDTLLAKGVLVKNCPTYSSKSVAEHAVALSFRAAHGRGKLPPLNEGSVSLIDFDESDSERLVGEILLRGRQIESSIARAAKYDYSRTDGPWHNKELEGISFGILDSRLARLAHILKKGFGATVLCQESDTRSKAAGAKPAKAGDILDADYVFVDEQMSRITNNWAISKSELEAASSEQYSNAKVAVLGGGRIGSRIAKIFRDGFGSEVSVYCRIAREELSRKGIMVTTDIGQAVEGSNLVIIALPLNEGTRGTLDRLNIEKMSEKGSRVIVNVGRSEIVDEEALIYMIDSGQVHSYATDVVPKEGGIWLGKEPSEITRRFVDHGKVIVTPHEADSSAKSIQRMSVEVKTMIGQILEEVA